MQLSFEIGARGLIVDHDWWCGGWNTVDVWDADERFRIYMQLYLAIEALRLSERADQILQSIECSGPGGGIQPWPLESMALILDVLCCGGEISLRPVAGRRWSCGRDELTGEQGVLVGDWEHGRVA